VAKANGPAATVSRDCGNACGTVLNKAGQATGAPRIGNFIFVYFVVNTAIFPHMNMPFQNSLSRIIRADFPISG
jgi:hypothetical protein